MRKKYKAFTLTELLLVIIILGILTAIGFSMTGFFFKDTRDATRVDNLKELENELEYYHNKNGYFPEPDNYKSIDIDGKNWKSGYILTGVIKKLGNINVIPKDPKTKKGYKYLLNENGTKYKLKTILEKSNNEYIVGN